MTRPQNQAGCCGHFLYKGSAPLFVTTKEEDLEKIEAAAGQAKQSRDRRSIRCLRIYKLHVPNPVAGNVTIEECPVCFARMTSQDSRDGRGLTRAMQEQAARSDGIAFDEFSWDA